MRERSISRQEKFTTVGWTLAYIVLAGLGTLSHLNRKKLDMAALLKKPNLTPITQTYAIPTSHSPLPLQ